VPSGLNANEFTEASLPGSVRVAISFLLATFHSWVTG
jgi:hypothetical protein